MAGMDVPRGSPFEAEHGGVRRWSRSSFDAEPSRRSDGESDEDELRVAALERLRSFTKPHRHAILARKSDTVTIYEEVDVKKLSRSERSQLVESALATADVDNEPFFRRMRERLDRVGLQFSSVEVRFKDLDIETDVRVGKAGLPSVSGAIIDGVLAPLSALGLRLGRKHTMPILKDCSGILYPGRLTLLLGPPGSGKSTLLKALSAKLDSSKSLRMAGKITYNGHRLDEFVCQRTSAYIEQRDVHIAELTVRETLDFAARVQGVGTRPQELRQLQELEAAAGFLPDPEIDAFMKAEAVVGGRFSVATEMMLRLLQLEHAADTVVGGEMLRGISGGERKRLTTGEMTVGPKTTLLCDEISTGLDSSTTFQIVKCIHNFVHFRQATVFMSLLQPAPEVFGLFDDVCLLSEGRIVFMGPKEEALPFFETMGFRLPERKGIADFLQEVTSRKDQHKYKQDGAPRAFVDVPTFAAAFAASDAARRTADRLAMPFDRAASQPGTLVKERYGLNVVKGLQAMLRREIVHTRRNSFIYIFQSTQVFVLALLTSALFFRTTLTPDSLQQAELYLGALFFSMNVMMFNNWAEFSVLVEQLPVMFKQRDNLFFRAWQFHLPRAILSIPQAIIESLVWSAVTYWLIGLAPETSRFFTYWLVNMLCHQNSVAMFRLMGAVSRTLAYATATAVIITLILIQFGGFVIPKPDIGGWWIWCYWISFLTWGTKALAINEFSAARWQVPDPNVPRVTLGYRLLQEYDFPQSQAWIWGGVAFMAASAAVLNACTIAALTFLSAPSSKGGTVSAELLAQKRAALGAPDANQQAAGVVVPGDSTAVDAPAGTDDAEDVSASDGLLTNASCPGSVTALAAATEPIHVSPVRDGESATSMQGSGRTAAGSGSGRRAATSTLPFQQLCLTFKHVWYSVDLPSGQDVSRLQQPEGAPGKPQLYLLNDVSGVFRPGVLCALVGSSGAGKTTLLDCLAGRKTTGRIQGDIRVQGHPKEQSTFARASGYVEQTDVHSPATTVHEALLFSASLRLPASTGKIAIRAFVREVETVVELEDLTDALVGMPGRDGLSVEQRKRLTIAVELVSNPSIVFMDEPTSGLDARAAAIVMRAVRNTVDTGRTVVCTIHQPSIDIFESFDELLLMKRGGRIIYFGALGSCSCHLVDYFQGIEGVPHLQQGANPAAWVLEVTGKAAEQRMGQDFADAYEGSELYRRALALIDELAAPPPGSSPLRFESTYARGLPQQLRVCLWKDNAVMWRSPEYNSVRLVCTLILAVAVGSGFWDVGSRRDTRQGVVSLAGAAYGTACALGIYNAGAVQPAFAIERCVFIRERAAGMYAVLPYALAKVACELPYILVQMVMYTAIVYPMLALRWAAAQVFWFLVVLFLTQYYMTLFGMLAIAITPNEQVAAMIFGSVYFLNELFCGFIIPWPSIPVYIRWVYWGNPVSWTVYGVVASQLGNVDDSFIVEDDGTRVSVSEFLEQTFGFRYSYMGVVIATLAAFSVGMWLATVASLRFLRFHKR